MIPARIIIPCPDMMLSRSGREYCHHPAAPFQWPYCRPDPRTSVCACPRGYPGHVTEIDERTEFEDDDTIEDEIRAGRQATLEGF